MNPTKDHPSFRHVELIAALFALVVTLPGCNLLIDEAKAADHGATSRGSHVVAAAKPSKPGGHVGGIDEECIPNQPGDCEQSKKKPLHSTKKECAAEEIPSYADTCPIVSGDPCFVDIEPSVCAIYTCRDVADGATVEECIGDITVPHGCKATPASCKPYLEP